MCTSIVFNKKKTIAVFNFDILDMQYRVRTNPFGVFIEIYDVKECFNALKEVAQIVCQTAVSMVYDVINKKVYWCENRKFDFINEYNL